MNEHRLQRWDIFCRVIDNYGDIGVCWRLAHQLAVEHGVQVRLWLDDLTSLQRLLPETDPLQQVQQCSGVEIRRWGAPFAETLPAEVVIEAFACELPENYLTAMAQLPRKPVWINLEYLSAESWVEGCHGLPSPHPRLPLTKYFFFPGFTPATGGLLRERDLLQQSATAQSNPAQMRQALGLPPDGQDETLVSLFCYDSAPLSDLLHLWEQGDTPLRCLVPEGQPSRLVEACCGSALQPGDRLRRGNLTLQALPFLPQQDYDRLLWACDFNFVRGEDSFVRAQWAGRPFAWQIYRQQQDAHLAKLAAFLDRYCAELEPQAAASLRNFHQGWNDQGALPWQALWQERGALQAHALEWRDQLATDPDLAAKLVIFCKNKV